MSVLAVVARRHAARARWARHVRPHQPLYLQARQFSGGSFIKTIQEHMKREMEKDENLRKDFEAIEKSGLTEAAKKQEEKLRNMASNTQTKVQEKTSNMWAQFRQVQEERKAKQEAEEAAKPKEEPSEAMKAATHFFSQARERTFEVGDKVRGSVSGAFNSTVDRAQTAFGKLGKSGDVRMSAAERWKKEQAARRASQEIVDKKKEEDIRFEQAKAEYEERTGKAYEGEAPNKGETAVVVSDQGDSAWDRFGARLADMPILQRMSETGVLDLFGETEIAASIREMKEVDPNFRLIEFQQDIEHLVAPHIVTAYLNEDADQLQSHCGRAAYKSMEQSIKQRRKLKVTLDPTVLCGPDHVELRGAKMMDKGRPCFIWTFQCQQINCLRDADGDVIDGAIDDIRQVHYLMAVMPHEDPDNPHLHYPWQVQEIAIIGNQPCI